MPRPSRPVPAPAANPPPGRPWSIGELVEEVNRWCADHHISPASGQAADRLTERNVRFYRTRGLLDAPGGGAGEGRDREGRRGFTEKHALQLRLIRLFQSRGLPLDHIRDQLQDQSVEELHVMERRELGQPELPMTAEAAPAYAPAVPPSANGGNPGSTTAVPGPEQWLVNPLGEDFLLISRRGQAISDEQRRLIIALLRA